MVILISFVALGAGNVPCRKPDEGNRVFFRSAFRSAWRHVLTKNYSVIAFRVFAVDAIMSVYRHVVHLAALKAERPSTLRCNQVVGGGEERARIIPMRPRHFPPLPIPHCGNKKANHTCHSIWREPVPFLADFHLVSALWTGDPILPLMPHTLSSWVRDAARPVTVPSKPGSWQDQSSTLRRMPRKIK